PAPQPVQQGRGPRRPQPAAAPSVASPPADRMGAGGGGRRADAPPPPGHARHPMDPSGGRRRARRRHRPHPSDGRAARSSPRARGPGPMGRSRLTLAEAAWAVVFTAFYVGAGKLGIELRVAHGVITPVWAPTGLAIAALFLFGPRLWPAVALGALLTNATSGVSFLTACGIAVGNTLEAVAGAFILRRARVDATLERARDILALVAASLVATTVSATIGTLTLGTSGDIAFRHYGSNWLLWWFGDVIGAL